MRVFSGIYTIKEQNKTLVVSDSLLLFSQLNWVIPEIFLKITIWDLCTWSTKPSTTGVGS